MTRKNRQLHPIEWCTSGIQKQWQKGVSKNKTKMKGLTVTALLPNISPGNSACRKQTNETTPEFISSLLLKLVIYKTSSLLTHDSSVQLSPLEYKCHQNDSHRLPTFELPPCRYWFKLRLWCKNWWWQVAGITEHLNKLVRINKK
jgi:hypothetical protein